LPLGAVLVSKKVADVITPGCHGSTFGGNPLSISAANKVVELVSQKLLNNTEEMGLLFKQKIESLNIDAIEEIRYKGLMIGIKFNQYIDVKLLAKLYLNKNIVVGTAGNNVLRLLPPLIIEEKHIDQFVYISKELFKNMNISTTIFLFR
jgi:acetylornithine/succinyldiaminopimelate/putrescine aminotransferase